MRTAHGKTPAQGTNLFKRAAGRSYGPPYQAAKLQCDWPASPVKNQHLARSGEADLAYGADAVGGYGVNDRVAIKL